MVRWVLTGCAGTLLVVLSCGDDAAKRVVKADGGAGGTAEAGAGPEPAQGGSMSEAGMPSIPVEGGAAGEAGLAGMPAQAGSSGEGPEPQVLDVGANRGGGRVQAGYHSCVVLVSGAVYCAGDNTYGALGNPATSGTNLNATLLQVSGPGGVGSLADADQVALGEGFSCARLSDGSVWCWGDNLFSQLGDGTGLQASSPVSVLDAD